MAYFCALIQNGRFQAAELPDDAADCAVTGQRVDGCGMWVAFHCFSQKAGNVIKQILMPRHEKTRQQGMSSAARRDDPNNFELNRREFRTQ